MSDRKLFFQKAEEARLTVKSTRSLSDLIENQLKGLESEKGVSRKVWRHQVNGVQVTFGFYDLQGLRAFSVSTEDYGQTVIINNGQPVVLPGQMSEDRIKRLKSRAGKRLLDYQPRATNAEVGDLTNVFRLAEMEFLRDRDRV